MSYQVFIERCLDPSPDGVKRAAGGIAGRFGVPAAAIEKRLGGGRFRVKNNVELAKARRFVDELKTLGVDATVVDAHGRVVPADPPADDGGGLTLAEPLPAAPAPAAAAKATTLGRAAVATPAPPAAPTPPATPAPAAPTGSASTLPPSSNEKAQPAADGAGNQYESGLAAAFGSDRSSQDLGILGGEEATDGGSMRLATIDGDEGGRAAEEPSEAAAPVAAATSEEAFLPPEMQEGAEDDLSLLTPVPEMLADAPASAGPGPEPGMPGASDSGQMPAASSSAQMPAASPSSQMPAASSPTLPRKKSSASSLTTLASNARARFAVGVLLGLLVGGLPAYVLGASRHDSAVSEIKKDLRDDYAQAVTPERWDLLEQSRQGAAELIESKQRSIAIGSISLWLVLAAVLLFVWERKIDWTRWARSEADDDPLAPI